VHQYLRNYKWEQRDFIANKTTTITNNLTVTTYGQDRSFWTGNAKNVGQSNTYDFKCSPDSSCFALQVINKTKTVDTSLITPFYNSDGLYIIQNGVYNFVVGGKKYFYYRVNNISSDSVYISDALTQRPY